MISDNMPREVRGARRARKKLRYGAFREVRGEATGPLADLQKPCVPVKGYFIHYVRHVSVTSTGVRGSGGSKTSVRHDV